MQRFNLFLSSSLVLTATTLVALSAHAQPGPPDFAGDILAERVPVAASAPELDPTGAAAAVGLVLAGAVLATRRRHSAK